MTPAFARLNLRHNPFGELTRRELAEVAVCDADDLAVALRSPGTALQVLAPCGRGKTTWLFALGHRIPHARYVRPDVDGVPDDGPWDVLLLDEADHLAPWTRARLLRRARSAAVATHRDRSWELGLLGFSVRTLRPRVDAAHLARVLDRRIEAARRGAGPVPRVPSASVVSLVARHDDDVRAVFADLYERFQRLLEPTDVVV